VRVHHTYLIAPRLEFSIMLFDVAACAVATSGVASCQSTLKALGVERRRQRQQIVVGAVPLPSNLILGVVGIERLLCAYTARTGCDE
jgi:hypothetical protein